MISANQIRLVELDNGPILAGDALSQAGATAMQRLNGAYAFTIGGGLNAAIVGGGVFTADGNGNISNGIEDFNNNGSLAQNLPIDGHLFDRRNGRGTMSFNNSKDELSVRDLSLERRRADAGDRFQCPQRHGICLHARRRRSTGNYGFNLERDQQQRRGGRHRAVRGRQRHR